MSVKYGQRVSNSLAKRGKTNFGNFYYTRCKEKNLFPSRIILNRFLEKYHALLLPIEKPKSDLEWDIIISSLNSKDNDLKTIAILTTDKGEGSNESIRKKNEKDSIFKLSEYEKNAAGLNEHFYTRLITSIVNYMCNENHLSILELCGLPLNLMHIQLLAKGLQNSKSIKILSLSRTLIKDEGLKILASSLKTSPSIMELHFAGCELTHESAVILTELIKYQCLRREAELWSNTLRPSITNTNRHAEIFGIPLNLKLNSLKRLNLCNNNIGDVGMNSLFDIIIEDLGLEALDVQFNSITNNGLKDIDYLIKLNKTLTIFDLRNNFIDEEIMDKINEFLKVNKELKYKQNPSELSSKTKEFKMLDGINPLSFSYHTKEIKITSSSEPSCEKLHSRTFPPVNPLLDKTKKKWSTFGPMKISNNSISNKRKNNSKKKIKSSSMNLSNNKVKVTYDNNVNTTDTANNINKNSKNIHNSIKKSNKSLENKKERKKFHIACIDDVSVDNLKNKKKKKNDIENIPINNDKHSNINLEINQQNDVSESELNNKIPNNNNSNPIYQSYITEYQNNAIDSEPYYNNENLASHNNNKSNIEEFEDTDGGNNTMQNIMINKIDEVQLNILNQENSLYHNISDDKTTNLLEKYRNQKDMEENNKITISDYKIDDLSHNRYDENSCNSEEVKINENEECHLDSNNYTLNTRINVQMTENSNNKYVESLKSNSSSVNNTRNENIAIENLTSNFSNEKNENIHFDNSINIPSNMCDNEQGEDIIPISKNNEKNVNRSNEDDIPQISIYETENNTNNNSLLNESFLINKSNKIIEKSIDLKEKINKTIGIDINFKQNKNQEKLKTKNSRKGSSKRSRTSSSRSNNDYRKTSINRSENYSNDNSIGFTGNDEQVNDSRTDILLKQINQIHRNNSNNSLKSNDSSIIENQKKNIRKNKMKVKKDNNTNSIKISENSEEEQDFTYIKIPGNILMKQSPTSLNGNNTLECSEQLGGQDMNVDSINEDLESNAHNKKTWVNKDEKEEIEEEVIKDNNNLFINIGNENEHLLSDNIKNKPKEKRELIYNTLNSLSELSDTIDAVENNIKNINEEIIQAPTNQPKSLLQKSKSDGMINDIDVLSSIAIRSNEDIQYTILSITNSLREIQSQTIQEMIESSHFLHPIVTSLQSIITYAKHLLKILNVFIEKKNIQKEKQKLIKTRSESNIHKHVNDLIEENKDITKKSNHHHHRYHHQQKEENKTILSSSEHEVKKHQKLEKYKFYKSQINVLLEVMESMINSYYTYMEKIEQNE